MSFPRPPLRLLLFGLVIVASGAFALVAWALGWVRADTVQQLIARAGARGMVAYVVAVAAFELLWMPRMWGLLAGGVLFGPWLGGALSIAADLLGAAIAFALARGAARAWLAARLLARPRAREWIALLAQQKGLFTIALLRVCPVAHYTLVSYAAGIVGTSPRALLLGTALGILPGAAVYPLLGHAALRPGSPAFAVALAVFFGGLLVSIVAGRAALRRMRAAAQQAAPPPNAGAQDRGFAGNASSPEL